MKKTTITWPQRKQFTLPNIVAYFREIEKLSKKMRIKLINQKHGNPVIVVKNETITAIGVNAKYHYLAGIFSGANNLTKIECGMCVGAHLHFLSDKHLSSIPIDTCFTADYKKGECHLAKLVFGSTTFCSVSRLTLLIARCFDKLTTQDQRKKYNESERESCADYKYICQYPFSASDWPVQPSKVIQCIIDHPKWITELKSTSLNLRF